VANVFALFRPASFEGIRFAWKTYDIRGGIRDHVHEYPHVHGGDAEKLGRKLYEISFSPIMHAGLVPQRYQDIFPLKLRELRELFESQKTGTLVIPHIGEIKAYALSWTERADANNISGLDVEWTFREDASGSFGQKLIIDTKKLAAATRDWTIETNVFKPRPNIFDQISDLALGILAIKDQLDLYGSLVAAKIEGLVSLIQEADAQVESLKDPDNYGALYSLQRLLDSTVDLANDIANRGQGLQIFTVLYTSTISDVAVSIYGSSAKAAEIMQLNTITNPLSIPAGTKLVYYA